jgi:putative ATPase
VTRAKDAAKSAVKTATSLEVPNHLRNAPLKGMAEQGYHEGYQYPHNSEGGVVASHYFPIGMEPQNFYEPTDRGYEEEIRERMQRIRSIIRQGHEKK